MTDRRNSDRIATGKALLAEYDRMLQQDDGDNSASDAISDLLHYVVSLGFDLATVCHTAQRNVEAEIEEEEGTDGQERSDDGTRDEAIRCNASRSREPQATKERRSAREVAKDGDPGAVHHARTQ